jgi:uncharacterized UBP type Zn finger protein
MECYGYATGKNTNIQQDTDSDDNEGGVSFINTKTTKKAKPAYNNVNKHFHLQFEVAVINRIVTVNVAAMSNQLLRFDEHPRNNPDSLPKYRKVKGENGSSPVLYDCLEYFRKTEKLEKENSWYCNKCKDHVEASKKIEVYRVPPVLILCLQRFKSHGNYFKEKLDDNVVFPLEGLDLTNHVLSNIDGQGKEVSLIYDCIAVSNHYGSLVFGHYTAYAKNFETGKWYDFNDSSVSAVGPYPE